MNLTKPSVLTYASPLRRRIPRQQRWQTVPEEVKEERRDELMELQQEISYDRGQDRIGQELLEYDRRKSCR